MTSAPPPLLELKAMVLVGMLLGSLLGLDAKAPGELLVRALVGNGC